MQSSLGTEETGSDTGKEFWGWGAKSEKGYWFELPESTEEEGGTAGPQHR